MADRTEAHSTRPLAAVHAPLGAPTRDGGSASVVALGVAGLVLVALLALLPSENWASGRLASALGQPGGSWVRLVSLATFAALAAAALWIMAGKPWLAQRRAFAIATLLFVLSGVVPVLTSLVTGGVLSLAIRDAWLGHVAPAAIVVGVLTLGPTVARHLWTAFFVGWCVYLVVGFLAVVGSTPSAGWNALGPAARLVMWKFEMLDTTLLFTRWVGNSNKAANVLLLGLLLAPTMLRIRDESPIRGTARPDPARVVAATYLVLATLMLVLLYSRACLFLLPIALLVGGWWGAFRDRRSRWAMALGATAVAFLLLAVPTTRNALLLGSYPTGESQGFLSTYTMEGGRFDQAQEVFSDLVGESNWFLGVGTGQYGLEAHGSIDAGTHNYLLDIWLAGGIVALALSIAWIWLCLGFSLLRWRTQAGRFGASAMVILLLLMSREYSAAYLGALSMGGIFIMLVIAASTGALWPRERKAMA